MKNITLTLFSYDELEKQAKESALTQYRDLNVGFDWWEDEYEDFVNLCACLGITVDKQKIYFSGFYAQEDGSTFSATVDIPLLLHAVQNQSWRDYAPLKEFGFTLPKIDRRVIALVANGVLREEPKIGSRVKGYGVFVDLGISVLLGGKEAHDNVFDELDKLQDWLRLIAVKLNYHLYTTLEKQYGYLISDEAIGETIIANDYLFTADGRSANHLLKLSENQSIPQN